MAGRMAVCVMPELAEFIGGELVKEATVSKGRVKAHELRVQLNHTQGGAKEKPGKGDSKGAASAHVPLSDQASR